MRILFSIVTVLATLCGVAVEIVSPGEGEVLSLLTDAQRHYLSLPRAERARYFADNDADKPKAFAKYGTLPKPVVLTWKAGPGEEEFAVRIVRQSDGKCFFDRKVRGTNVVEVWNLEVARTWEGSVASTLGKASVRFRTSDEAPRFLKIDAIKNCRDLGGRKGLDGRRVRQGMVLRTQGLNANAKFKREKGSGEPGKILEPPTKRGEDRLTEDSRRFLLQDIGIKTDIDLRNEYECFGMNGSPLGPTVRWEHHSLIAAYSLIQHPASRKTLTEVFRIFLEEKNYPIVFHCIGGADRTGCVAFALNALLGVPEEELYKDYEVTAMGNSFRKGGLADQKHWRGFNHMVEGFRSYPGETLRQKVENGFRSLGFSEADFLKFREIMLEGR